MSFLQGVVSELGKDLLRQIDRGFEFDVTPKQKLGFDAIRPSIEGAFVRICAIKTAKKPHTKLARPFRRAT